MNAAHHGGENALGERMYRFLLTKRWVALALVMLAVIPGCILLGQWQLDRLHKAERHNERINSNAEAAPSEIAPLSPVGSLVPPERVYKNARIVGRYDAARTLLIRNRPAHGQAGFFVLTPLVTDAGPAALVNRGWIPAPAAGGSPELPETPSGTVTVTGLLRASESPKSNEGLPVGQVQRMDVAAIAPSLPYPVYGGYVALRTQDPAPPVVEGIYRPEPVPLPSGRTELLHLAYAWQWFVFAAIGPLGFWFLVRREVKDRQINAGTSSSTVPAAASTATSTPSGNVC
ncbi:MAG: SURF1 family cytochrome oxidase biogenesis protein [Sporichthyaceae bacterium]